MKNILIIFFVLLGIASTHAGTIELHQSDCENNGDRFDSDLTIQFSQKFSGDASCRVLRNVVYQLALPAPTSIEFLSIELELYSRSGRLFDIRGQTNSGNLPFTRTVRQNVRGIDNRNWFRHVYVLQSNQVSNDILNFLSISLDQASFIDEISLRATTTSGEEHYFRFVSPDNLVQPVDIENVFSLNPLNANFQFRGRFLRGEKLIVSAIDQVPLSHVYLLCQHIQLLSIGTHPLDPPPQFSITCEIPDPGSNDRLIFSITNHSAFDYNFAIEFSVNMSYFVRITELAPSTTVNKIADIRARFLP